MKKVILLGVFVTLLSCKEEEKEVRILTPEQADYEAVQNKILEGEEIIEGWGVEEFEYKGHTYMYNTVHSGISAWHAGHCRCNPNR
jgi:hypothetical protein